MKQISVVIATYNRADLLVDLLRDLAHQTLPLDDFEVIVVDDGSADPPRPRLEALELPYALTILEQQNKGPAAARHAGVLRASAPIIVILDDDMSIEPSFLEEHLASHRAGNTLVLGHIVLDQKEDAPKPLFERFHAAQLMGFLEGMRDGRIVPRGAYVCTGNVSFRRDDYLAVGGFDPTLDRAEDRELGVRLEKAGARLAYCDAARAHNRSDHTDIRIWYNRNFRYGIADARIAEKHPDVELIDPWRFLFEVNPVSRPLLLLAAMAPRLGLVLSRAAMDVAMGVDRLGSERIAIAGATLAYGLDYFRGVREEAGSLTNTARGFYAYLHKRRASQEQS